MTTKTKDGKKRRFTVLDIILLLLALAAVGFAIYYFSPFDLGRAKETETTSLEFTVEVKGMDEEFVRNIAVGDTVIDSVTKKTVGTVSAVESLPYTEYVVNYEKNAIEEKEYPGQATLLITVAAAATREEKGYTVGDGYRVAIGVLHYFQLPNYVCSGYCISMNVEE